MDKKRIDLGELRIKLDQLCDTIVSLLKYRSRYGRNRGVFEKQFAEGMTWFEYRLKKEQDIDAEFGRFLYHDQGPLLFKKSELASPRVERIVPEVYGLEQIQFDISAEIVAAYQGIIDRLCDPTEDEVTYGQTAKLDVEILLTLNERIVGIGEQVAQYKLETIPELKSQSSPEKIRSYLVIPERESVVVSQAVSCAERFAVKDPVSVGNFMQQVINMTTDIEVRYILARSELK